MLAGPSEMMRLASPSPSTRGGGVVSFWGLTRRQVMRVGAAQVRGGMMTRRPLCLLPRIDPPRASTIKLTRNLVEDKVQSHSTARGDISLWTMSAIYQKVEWKGSAGVGCGAKGLGIGGVGWVKG